MTKTWIQNTDCCHRWGLHQRRDRCDTYMDQADDGTWYAKCAHGSCISDSGEAQWRAGSKSGFLTYDELYDLAAQHCLKHHKEHPPAAAQ